MCIQCLLSKNVHVCMYVYSVNLKLSCVCMIALSSGKCWIDSVTNFLVAVTADRAILTYMNTLLVRINFGKGLLLVPIW